MSLAINLAKKNLGLTAPNPSVGCVIVKNNQIIATGITSIGGRPHAERVAIDSISDKTILHGATLYSTLEPCCHFGLSAPCTDLIIENKIGSVVVGEIDPDSRVNGGGIAKLKAAGIKILTGICEQETKKLNHSFSVSKSQGRPLVSLKIATSLDGKIATKTGDSKWISNEKSRKFAHILRAEADAILIGGNTVRLDNPSLDCRILGLEHCSPHKLILSQSLNFSFNEKIFATKKGSASTILLTHQANFDSKNLQNWLQKSSDNQVVFFDAVQDSNPKQLKLDLILQKICSLGINSLLVEGGSSIATAFLQQNLVDELIWIRSQKIIGNDGIPALQNLGLELISDCLDNFAHRKQKIFDNDLLEFFSK